MGEVTELIVLAHAGDQVASAKLFTDVYGELKRIAGRQIRRIHDAPMHTTALVHEAYFRLAKPEALTMRDRQHFFAVAARAMRQLLLDEVRARHSVKRSDHRAVSLDAEMLELGDADALLTGSAADVYALEQALTQLAAADAGLGRLVELRFYAGLDLAEIAELTERSERSLKRDWRKARAFLHAQLAQGPAPDTDSDD